MQNRNTEQSKANSFHLKQAVAGAKPLNSQHIKVINAAFPDQAKFTAGVVKHLGWHGADVPASLVANFTLLKDMYDKDLFGAYGKFGIHAVEVKFSFMKVNDDNSNSLYETRAQQILQHSYLLFNMSSSGVRRFNDFLAQYGLTMGRFQSFGCCLVKLDQLDEYKNCELHDLYSNINNTKATLTTPFSLQQANDYVSDADIYAVTKLDDVVSSLMHIDNFSPEEEKQAEVGNTNDSESIMDLYYS